MATFRAVTTGRRREALRKSLSFREKNRAVAMAISCNRGRRKSFALGQVLLDHGGGDRPLVGPATNPKLHQHAEQLRHRAVEPLGQSCSAASGTDKLHRAGPSGPRMARRAACPGGARRHDQARRQATLQCRGQIAEFGRGPGTRSPRFAFPATAACRSPGAVPAGPAADCRPGVQYLR